MNTRLVTTGHQPLVEYRSSVDRYFILFEDLGVELAPAFTHRWTAYEVAVNSFYGVPFFTMIPIVPLGTEYPRPNILMPKVEPLEISLRLR